MRATDEVASWASGQLELAELDESRHRLVRAEVRALRAQISPHFVYNSLGAIASFVRTDPDRARELLLEFADFTRYSFREHGEFTTLAEELRSIERYLLLEQARFGDRLQVTLQVAPEVLGVSIPFLCLQPLVENAVQHGLESEAGVGHITIEARDADRECVIAIEDDGAGQDPERIRRGAGRRRRGRLGGPGQRRRAAAHDLRRRVRPGRGDRAGCGHAGRRARAEVRRRGERMTPDGLTVLVIDDERPALDELTFLLGRDPRVAEVHGTDSPTDALRMLQQLEVDAVFLDVQMPGLTGVELAQVLSRFRTPARHRLRHRPRPARGRRLRPRRRGLRAQARARGPSGRGRAPGARRRPPEPPRAPRSRCRSSAAGSRGSCRSPRSATSRPRATTPGCTPPTRAHLVRVPLTQLEDDWAPPASCASTAPC